MVAISKSDIEEYERGLALETGNGGSVPSDPAAAVRVYRNLIEGSGYSKAKAALGRLYDRGYGGLKRNEDEALRLFQEAAHEDDAFGFALLGWYYFKGRGGLVRNEKRALELFRLSAEAGDPEGAVAMGCMYSEGRCSLEIDDAKALKYYRYASDAGWVHGDAWLGLMYAKGKGGLVRNEEEGLRLTRAAAAEDDPAGLSSLGVYYIFGDAGVESNQPKGAELYRRSAEAGDSYAMLFPTLAGHCNVDANISKGYQWIKRSADEGTSGGIKALGNAYQFGFGVERDDAKALELFREAARLNNSNAARDLGKVYMKGALGLATNHEKAVHYLRMAADQGDTGAMGYLAEYFSNGMGGVKQDKVEALRLVEIAVRAEPTMRPYTELKQTLLHEDPSLEQQLAKRLDIAALFVSAAQEGSPVQEWMRSKLMLVGQGRVGKSCTLRSLLCQDFDANMKSTRGADTKTCTVERVNVQRWKEQNTEARGFDDALAFFVARSIGHGDDEEEAPRCDDQSMGSSKAGVDDDTSRSKRTDSAAATTPLSKRNSPTPRDAAKTQKANAPRRNNAELERIKAHNERLQKEAEDMVQRFNKEGNVEMIMKIRQQNNTQELSFSVWDYGGQRVFYALHHLFLTRYGVYLVCFNLEELVVDDEREGALRFLNFWLNSVRMHAEGAPVLLVGTHKDRVPNPAQHAQIAGVLRARLGFDEGDSLKGLRLHPYAETGLPFFPVDNTTSGTENEDPVLSAMRAAVQDAVKDDPLGYINLKFPISWRNVLDEMLRGGEAFLSLDDVHEIAEKCFASSSDVPNMLKLLHELGALVYFGDNPALSDVVTLKPQWLVDALSLIIRDYGEHDNNFKQNNAASSMSDAWATLKEKAVISKALLRLLWRGYDEKYLTELMMKSNLLCPWPSFGRSSGKAALRSYLVPSLLHNAASTELGPGREDGDRYLFDFSSFFLPDGLFERMVCAVLMKETAESEDAQCLRGANVTANVARLATRSGKFRLEGERRVTALGDDDTRVGEATTGVPRDCVRVVVEHSSDGGAAILDLIFGLLEDMNAATFGGGGHAGGGLKWCVRAIGSDACCTTRTELPEYVRRWLSQRADASHRAQYSNNTTSRAFALEEIESGPVKDFIRCSRAIVGLLDSSPMEADRRFLGTGLFVSFKGHLCVLTNAHVLASPKQALKSAVAFEYGASLDEEIRVLLEPSVVWATSSAPADMTGESAGTLTASTMDYVLCSLNMSTDEATTKRLLDRQPIVLSTDPRAHLVEAEAKPRVIAFGHPAGLRQYTSRGRITARGSLELTYSGQTFGGSSGSPVFTETSKEYRLVGLHRSGDLGHSEGRGLRLDALIEDLLQQNLPEEAVVTDDGMASDALDDIEITFAGEKRVETLTNIELADSVRPLLPNAGRAYERYLQNMAENDEIDGKEVVQSVKNNELGEIMEELGVMKKRHSRRLTEAFIQLITSDDDYRPLYDFMKLHRLEDLFMRFLQAGVYKDLDLLLIYGSGRKAFKSFLTEPPMHLNDIEQAKVSGAAVALANNSGFASMYVSFVNQQLVYFHSCKCLAVTVRFHYNTACST